MSTSPSGTKYAPRTHTSTTRRPWRLLNLEWFEKRDGLDYYYMTFRTVQ